MNMMKRTMLVYETVEAGATWSTVKPKNHRILWWVSFGFHKIVKQILAIMIFTNCHIPTQESKSNIIMIQNIEWKEFREYGKHYPE